MLNSVQRELHEACYFTCYFTFPLSDIKKQALEGFAFSIGISRCQHQIFCVMLNIVVQEEKGLSKLRELKSSKNFIISEDALLPSKHVTWVHEVLPICSGVAVRE